MPSSDNAVLLKATKWTSLLFTVWVLAPFLKLRFKHNLEFVTEYDK